MFYFLHSAQDQSNYRYYKGLLFEELLRTFLKRNGFDVALNRKKHNSLEYDIEGTHKLDKRVVSGEAKAHDDTIAGEVVAAFVGKLAPLHFKHAGGITGLFLSTSALSPDAEDYLENLKQTSPFKIERFVGNSLEAQIRESLGFGADHGPALAARAGLHSIHASHLLHTDHGTLLLAVGASTASKSLFPDRFAAFQASGEPVSDVTFLQRVRDSLEPLRELEPSYVSRSAPSRPDVPEGLVTSADWLDFRHPAAPEFFVGREAPLDAISQAISDSSGGIVIEVKSRSGVGKSSLLAAMAARWQSNGARVELHDARDVHSSVDVLGLARRFLRFEQPIPTLEALAAAVSAYEPEGDRWSFFVVDQFESCFQVPEVFRAYEYLAMCIVRSRRRIAFVLARKDDLLTTHDDVAINLERLRQLSSTIQLDDFTRAEALDLVSRIAAILPRKVNHAILTQVLEFAQGFPWLLRRTMAHVVKLLLQQGSQQTLISTGLHLADLFQEELDELDEVERGYLVRIAAALPATYHSLLSRFEGDPQIPKMLERLTGRRVLRFSAGTYDTYNDVFKDYLLYDRMPERSQSALHKMGPVPVMKAFRALKGASTIDIQQLGRALGKSVGGTYNTLRELRLAGLVARKQDEWIVPQVVRDYEFQNRLGEYVRQALIKNRAVHDFMRLLERQSTASFKDTASFLTHHFPFVQASDRIWESYARTFLLWLELLKFAHVDEGQASLLAQSETVLEELGNLVLHGRATRTKNMPFLPSKELTVLERTLALTARIPKHPSEFPRNERTALLDLARLGALESHANGTYSARVSWSAFVENVQRRFAQPPYVEFWSRVKAGGPTVRALSQILGDHGLAQGTLVLHAGKLVSWGKALGILPQGRYKHV
jgi:hypothetical protein